MSNARALRLITAMLFVMLNPLVVRAQPAPQVMRADTVSILLADMVRTALAANLRLASVTAETRGIKSEARGARSPFDPTLGVSTGTSDKQYGAQVSGALPTGAGYFGAFSSTSPSGILARDNAFQAFLNQPLLRGFGFASLRNNIRSADESFAAAEARLAQMRVNVVADVGILYSQLIERHQQESVQARSLLRAEELGAAYGELRRLDKITEVDLITAQLGVTTRRAELVSARRARLATQDNLVVAVYGASAASRFPSDEVVLMPRDSVLEVAANSLDEVMKLAIANRPDVEAARRELLQVRLLESSSRNAMLPALDVAASLSNTRSDLIDPLSGFTQSSATGPTKATFGLTLSQPLFNIGRSADRERAIAAVDLARVALSDAENVVRVEVRAANRDSNVNRELVRLATESSQLARRQYDGERARLDLGLTDIFRVLQVNDQVAKVEQQEASARLALASAYVRMRAAVGEGGLVVR